MAAKKPLKALEAALRRKALAYPEAHEDFPWGERVVKVWGKVFIFMRVDAGEFGLSVKLPATGGMALLLPGTTPTAYGLARSGWVSASFTAKSAPPLALLLEWLDESYRAVAPKKVVLQLDDRRAARSRLRSA